MVFVNKYKNIKALPYVVIVVLCGDDHGIELHGVSTAANQHQFCWSVWIHRRWLRRSRWPWQVSKDSCCLFFHLLIDISICTVLMNHGGTTHPKTFKLVRLINHYAVYRTVNLHKYFLASVQRPRLNRANSFPNKGFTQ